MKKILKIIGVTLFLSILTMGILFFVNPSYWFGMVFPVKVEVKAANTKITAENIAIDLQFILKESKRVKYIADSIDYTVFIDGDVLIIGACNIDKNIINGDVDTIMFPLSLSRAVLKSKTTKFKKGDSTNLKIRLVNHIEVPLFGAMEIPIEREFRVAAPQAPEVKVTNVKKIKLKLKDAIYELELDIYNPNYVEIALLQADVFVDIKGLFKGDVRSPGPVRIKPKAHSTITARIDLDEFNLINDGLKVVFKPQKEWDYYIAAKLLIAQENAEPVELVLKNTGKTKLLGLK